MIKEFRRPSIIRPQRECSNPNIIRNYHIVHAKMHLFPILLSLLSCVSGTTYYLGDDPKGDNVTVLRILVLLPQQVGTYNFPFGLEMAGSAILSAFKDIAANGILPGLSFKADFADSGCDGVLGIGKAYEMLGARTYSAIIGPQCSRVCSQVARLAAYLNLPCFSGVCQDVEMGNKAQFKTLTRLLGTFEMTGLAVCEIMHNFNWRRASILAERSTDIIWILSREGLEYAFGASNVTLALSTLVLADMDWELALLETARVSRVIIVAMNAAPFRDVIRLAVKHELTNGDYIFICLTYYKQTRVFGDYNWKQGDPDDDVLKIAYKSVFFISYYNRDQSDVYQQFLKSVKTDSAQYFGYHYAENEDVPYPAANLYEATYLFAEALRETIRDGGDITDGESVSKRLWGRSFDSLTGGVYLNDNGDRDQAYMIRHVQNDVTGDIELIGTYFSANRSLNIFPRHITWPGGRVEPPDDTPECGFDGELCREDAAARLRRVVAIFSGSLIGVIILGAVSFILIYRRLRWLKEISNMTWKHKLSDIIFTKQDKWGSQGSMMGRFSIISLKSAGTTATGPSQQSPSHFVLTTTGLLKGMRVALKPMKHLTQVNLADKMFLKEMKLLYDLTHTNLAKIMGATVEPPDIYLITEYCAKGSLQDLLENDDVDLDLPFKYSLMCDIINGLVYLHTSFRGCHGNLKSSNCVVDSRFVVKLTDFGPTQWITKPSSNANELLWTPPELLIDGDRIKERKPQADVYALGVIVQEIIYRQGPFYRHDSYFEIEEIIHRVRADEKPPFRPHIWADMCPPDLVSLITQCWSQDPMDRPIVLDIQRKLKVIIGPSLRGGGLMDNLLHRMEHYAQNLELMVGERTSKYLEEKKRAEDLLHRLLPGSVAVELQTKGFITPKSFDSVTVYFSDIVQFTKLCSESKPMQVITMLNDLYTMCDEVIAKYDVYKVETIGDAYMAVSGLPTENGDNHVSEIAKMALALRTSVHQFRIHHKPDVVMLLRIGMHTGPCVAGVVGLTMPRYCLFGDTVNTAARMESTGEALKIHMSPETNAMLEKKEGFTMAHRGEISVKGKGILTTYWLVSGPEQIQKQKSIKIEKKVILNTQTEENC